MRHSRVIRSARIVIALALLLVPTACEVPAEQTHSVPSVPKSFATTKSESFVLFTHCGIGHTMIDGRYYVADPPIRGSVGPPPGWHNPMQRGTMTLFTNGTALFTDDAGHRVQFVAHRAPRTLPGCA
jgi:hypothetical protein